MMRPKHFVKARLNTHYKAILCLILMIFLAACGQPGFEDSPIPPPEGKVLVPETGALSDSEGSATIDYSNASEGYVMAKYSGEKQKIKLMIEKDGVTYKYDLATSGGYEVFPLTMGDGAYKIGIYENVSGSTYAEALTSTVDVALRDALLPYLYPSQYVNFDAASAAVAKGKELASGAGSQLEIVSNVYNFVIENIAYDRVKAARPPAGYLPVVDDTLATGKGICFDYAVLMAAMLRSQSIPTRLEVGYVSGGVYHAWISVYTPETGWINDVIEFDGVNWSMMDPTLAAGDGANEEFIGDGTNYSLMYQY